MPKKPLPQFVPPMQASSVKEPFDSTDWIFETKLDGYWAVAVIGSGGNARIWSRNHLPLEPKFPTVREAVNQLRLRSTILDGEIVALDEEGIPRFQLLQKWQKRRRLADRRNRLSFLGQTLRILLAPFQRLPDNFVFVRAREMPQEPLTRSLVDKCCKSSPVRGPPGMQLDRMRTMIDALLK
jgi:hypothetical protein